MKKILVCILFMTATASICIAQGGWDLKKCVEYAITNNLDINFDNLQNNLSQEDLRQAKMNRFPDLNANINHGYNWGQRIDPFTNSFANERVRNNNFNLSSNILLYNGSRLTNQIKRAELEYEASELDVEQTKNLISTQVAQAYLRHILAKEQVSIANYQIAISREQSERMKKLVDAGQEALGSLYDINAQLANDEFALVNAKNEVELSKVALMNILQLPNSEAESFKAADPKIEDTELSMPNVSSAVLYQTAMSNLPEVKAAKLRVEQSILDQDIAKSQALPTLSLFGSIGSGYSGLNQEGIGEPTASFVPVGQVGIGGATVFTLSEQETFAEFQTKSFTDQLDQNFNQALGINLSIPLFNNYSSKINAKKSQISAEMAMVNSERVSNRLSQETRDVHANSVAALNKFKAAEISEQALQLSFDNAKNSFEQGLINGTDFNVAKSRLQNQQSQKLIAKYEYIFSLKVMDIYMGRLNP